MQCLRLMATTMIGDSPMSSNRENCFLFRYKFPNSTIVDVHFAKGTSMNPDQYYQMYTAACREGDVPPAPPPSPVLPSDEELDTVFVPAAIMTPNGKILPEKILTATGEPAATIMGEQRTALAETVPIPVVPLEAPSIVANTTGSNLGRPLIRRTSAHVFYNLTEAAPVATEWQVKPVLTEIQHAGGPDAPILPAPTDVMLDAGEGYMVKDMETGKVLAEHTASPV